MALDWRSLKPTVEERGTTVHLAVAAGAGALGLLAWIAAYASAPRYSFGAHEDMGNSAYFPLLLGASVAAGWLYPRRAGLVGLALGLPGFLLSPWTAPRGDNDGLWTLIIPVLFVFTGTLVVVAQLVAAARLRFSDRRSHSR